MKSFWSCLVGVAWLLGQAHGSIAEETCPAGALGVSRVAEIDTKGGPWFGEPYGDRDFLANGEVVLTFDDGPVPRFTEPILATLAAQCTKATFFVVGEMAAEFPKLVHDTAAQGHTVGTHTWSHLNMARLSEAEAKAQIEIAFSTIVKAADGQVAPFFRYPYLSSSASNVAYLKSRDIAQIAVDVDSLDWRTSNPDSVIRRVMAGLEHRGKGIILFHDIHSSTVKALPKLLALLKDKGFKVVHLKPRAAATTVPGYDIPPPAGKPKPFQWRSLVGAQKG